MKQSYVERNILREQWMLRSFSMYLKTSKVTSKKLYYFCVNDNSYTNSAITFWNENALMNPSTHHTLHVFNAMTESTNKDHLYCKNYACWFFFHFIKIMCFTIINYICVKCDSRHKSYVKSIPFLCKMFMGIIHNICTS